MYFGIEKNGLSLNEISTAVNGTPYNFRGEDTFVYGICTDTRKNPALSLFIALKGENFNGHDFIGAAYSKGAICAVTDRIINTDKPFIVVENTTVAYGKIASVYKKKFKLLTVAVTGSVGKTTTKEAICAVLSSKLAVCKTEANFNNEIGIPQTLLGINANHRAAVIEMGMCAMGEIASLSKITEPDISVITNIGSSHIGNLGSKENICKAKLEIVEGMKKDAILLLNGDDEYLQKVPIEAQTKKLVGIENENCDFRAVNIREENGGMKFDLVYDGEIYHLFIGALGNHSVMAASFAAACGIICGMSETDLQNGLNRFMGGELRQKIINRNGFKIIDDCYNASPESMRASIDVLKCIKPNKSSRAIAVLGEMKELGSFSSMMHEAIGEYAAQNDCVLFIFGNNDNTIAMAKAYEHSGKKATMLGDDYETAAQIIKTNIKEGDVLLFKASRAVKLENVAEKI